MTGTPSGGILVSCSFNSLYVRWSRKVPRKVPYGDAKAVKRHKIGAKEAQQHACRRRLLKLAIWLGVVLAALLVAIAVGLLWKPAGADLEGPRPAFVQALTDSQIPLAGTSLWAQGRATLTITEGQLADLAGAALNRADASVPAPVSRAVARNVPPWVESVSGCAISPRAVTLYVKCRKVFTFYVTVSGQLSARRDGSLVCRIGSLAVGLFRVPSSLMARAVPSPEIVLIDPRQTQFGVVSLSAGEGELTVELEMTGEARNVRRPV